MKRLATLLIILSACLISSMEVLAMARSTSEEIMAGNLNASAKRCFYRVPLGLSAADARKLLPNYYRNNDYDLITVVSDRTKIIGFAYCDAHCQHNELWRSGTLTIHLRVKIVDGRIIGLKYVYWFSPYPAGKKIKIEKTRGDY